MKPMTVAEWRARQLEKDGQEAIIAYLWATGIPAFAVPNRGLYNVRTGRYNVVDRMHFRGVPDVVAPLSRGRTLFIETKRLVGGQLSMEQEAFHKRLRDRGHLVLVARSVTDVQDFERREGPLR